MSRSFGHGGQQAAQPNNTYIQLDNPRNPTAKLYCCSNSTFKNVGSLTLPNGNTISLGDHFYASYLRLSLDRSNQSCLYLSAQVLRNHISYGSRINIGVFTCNIPDTNGRIHHISFALYNNLRGKRRKFTIPNLQILLHLSFFHIHFSFSKCE